MRDREEAAIFAELLPASESCMCLEIQHMQIQTKLLWLKNPVVLGDQIDGWYVCWIGGGDRRRVLFGSQPDG